MIKSKCTWDKLADDADTRAVDCVVQLHVLLFIPLFRNRSVIHNYIYIYIFVQQWLIYCNYRLILLTETFKNCKSVEILNHWISST